jgi:hypothetical protein
VRVEDRVALLLPALPGKRLDEVAAAVEQADADERDAEVAGRLEVVAGQDPEATGVLRQHRGDAELGREVGDGARQRVLAGVLVVLVPTLLGPVGAEIGNRLLEPRPELPVVSQFGEPGRRHRAEQLDRVVADRVPGLGVDGGEDRAAVRVPAPAEIGRQLAQREQLGGQGGADGESSDSSHPANLVAFCYAKRSESEQTGPATHRTRLAPGCVPSGRVRSNS